MAIYWAQAKNKQHDASGIADPQNYTWAQQELNGTYYPDKRVDDPQLIGIAALDRFTATVGEMANDAFFTDMHSILTEHYNPSEGDLLCQLCIVIDRMKAVADKARTK